MNPLQIIYGIVGLACVSAIGAYLLHCESVKKTQAQAVIVAEKAKDKAEKETKRLQGVKEKNDAEAKRLTADNAALARKLRESRARSGFVPPAGPLAASPSRASFDRAELERTLQRLDDGVSSIVAEGDAARVGLDTAKAWAKDITPRQ